MHRYEADVLNGDSMGKAYAVHFRRVSVEQTEPAMSAPGAIQRDLVLHALASTLASYLLLSHAVDIADSTSSNHWWTMIISLIAGGIQTAGLVARCMTIDWWTRRGRSVHERHWLFLHRHAGLVTGAVLVVVIGYVLIYDGYWALYEAYARPYPDNPFWLDALWIVGHITGLLAALGYGRLILRQIETTYCLPRRQQIAALLMGIVPEAIVYTTFAVVLLELAILIFGGSR